MTPVTTPLQELSPGQIRANPDNPRLVFLEEDMKQLMDSIREVGIKVPISVYADGTHFVLLDGERRWRCAKRLNLSSIPAIIQGKPSKLENLLMMFNIHNVRVDWDLMPMATKLGEVRDMLQKSGKATDLKALAAITGVPRPTVQRALDLLDLPAKYQTMLLKEAGKPRSEQHVKPDLFIEIYRSLHVIESHTPEVLEQVSKGSYVDSMVKKYLHGVIENVVSFRELSKIARAEKAGVDRAHAITAIVQLVRRKGYGITQAYEDTVQLAYEQRDLATKLSSVTQRLSQIKSRRSLSEEVISALTSVRREINRLLGSGR
jgi:ParB/RepB/Spo0J family partition protein